jgi:hypothetical protein
MACRNCFTLIALAILANALPACGGSSTSNSSATSGGAGNASGGSGGGLGTTGGAAAACTVGADQTCNDDPRVSSLWGHCQAGVCQCNAGTERSPTTGKCSSTCYSPRQNVDLAYEPEAVGCSCDAAVDYDTCRADSGGRLVAFECSDSNWGAVEDGACQSEGATITLKRSPCFGQCPSYSVTLKADGLVAYEGTSYVQVHGEASRSIAESAVRALADYMENARYFELPSAPQPCTQQMTDRAIVTTSLERYGRKHDVVHDLGNGCAPPELTLLEERIDEVAGTSEWTTCPPDDYCRDP